MLMEVMKTHKEICLAFYYMYIICIIFIHVCVRIDILPIILSICFITMSNEVLSSVYYNFNCREIIYSLLSLSLPFLLMFVSVMKLAAS